MYVASYAAFVEGEAVLVRTYVHTYRQPWVGKGSVGRSVPHVGYPMQAMQVSACMRGVANARCRAYVGGICMGR